jgi:GR25 family glycosyltransferase involved in LPS biosynthesis
MKCFIIHLPNIKNSLNSALKLKKQLEDFNHEVIMFEGTPGDEAIKIFEQKNIKLLGDFSELEKKEKYFLKSIRPGVKGCFYSHYQCWKQCTTLNEPILIFEDDVVLKKNFFPVEFEDILIVASSHKKKMLHYKKYLENNIDKPAAEDYSRFSMPGNAGYVIKPHAAEILVNTYKNVYVPADNAINQSLVKIQIHNHMMGKAEDRNPTAGKSSLIRTRFWDNKE